MTRNSEKPVAFQTVTTLYLHWPKRPSQLGLTKFSQFFWRDLYPSMFDKEWFPHRVTNFPGTSLLCFMKLFPKIKKFSITFNFTVHCQIKAFQVIFLQCRMFSRSCFWWFYELENWYCWGWREWLPIFVFGRLEHKLEQPNNFFWKHVARLQICTLKNKQTPIQLRKL